MVNVEYYHIWGHGNNEVNPIVELVNNQVRQISGIGKNQLKEKSGCIFTPSCKVTGEKSVQYDWLYAKKGAFYGKLKDNTLFS